MTQLIKILCLPCLLAALISGSRAAAADLGAADVVDAPNPKAESTSVSELPPPPPPAPEEPPAEIIPLPPSRRSLEQAKPTIAPKIEKTERPKSSPASKFEPADAKPEKLEPEKEKPSPAAPEKDKPGSLLSEARKGAPSYLKPAEPGYPTVLSGTLTEDLELTPQMSPVLIVGTFVVPEKIKLTVQGGTLIRLRADTQAPKPTPGTPDPSLAAVVWIWGTLNANGATGNPAEFVNLEKADASLLLYGTNDCKLDGVRLKGMNVAQNGGAAQWTNCEFVGSGSYAMAAGAGIFTQCTFRRFGGIFATYDVAPWSMLVRRSLFDRCREGIILGSNPGEARLIVEKNHFIGTLGAHIRALPLQKGKTAASADGKKPDDMEVLIGENWYGSAIPEETDMRIVDRRNDPTIRARLNTRPPASQPYTNIGAGMKVAVLEAAAKEQQSTLQKLLQAHQSKQKSLSVPARQVAKKGA